MPQQLAAIAEILRRSGTWFTIDHGAEAVSADTRRHGDVGEERPGREDIVEGRRLLQLVHAAFPEANANLETVDEWVTLTVDIGPRRYSTNEMRTLATQVGLAALVQALGLEPGPLSGMGGTYDTVHFNFRDHMELGLWGNSPQGLAVFTSKYYVGDPSTVWEPTVPTRAGIAAALRSVARRAGLAA
jgi:hypothetical protein